MTSTISRFDVVSMGDTTDTLPPSLARSLDSILTTLEKTYNVDEMTALIDEFLLHAISFDNPHNTAELFALYVGVLDLLYTAYRETTLSPLSRDEFTAALFTYVNRITDETQLTDPGYQNHALGVRFLKLLTQWHDQDLQAHAGLLAPLQPTLLVPHPTFHAEQSLTFGRFVPTTKGGQQYYDSTDVSEVIPYYLTEVHPNINTTRDDGDHVGLASIGIPSLYPEYGLLQGMQVTPELQGTVYLTGQLTPETTTHRVPLLTLMSGTSSHKLHLYREIGTKDSVTIAYTNSDGAKHRTTINTGADVKLFLTYARDGYRVYWRPLSTLLRTSVPVAGMMLPVDTLEIGVPLSSGAIPGRDTIRRISTYAEVFTQDLMLLLLDTDLK